MALQELNRLCVDAREKFADIKHIAICHRLGLVFNYYCIEKEKYGNLSLILIMLFSVLK
jgi:hypothetical protein